MDCSDDFVRQSERFDNRGNAFTLINRSIHSVILRQRRKIFSNVGDNISCLAVDIDQCSRVCLFAEYQLSYAQFGQLSLVEVLMGIVKAGHHGRTQQMGEYPAPQGCAG